MIYTDEVYGRVEIKEPVILELLKTKPLQRIKKVNQAGTQLVKPHKTVTRWDHCVGVMLLLKRFGASLEEQIAGLLHDVPHTAFSHAVDFAFKEGESQTFHERFLEEIVFNSEIPFILEKFSIDSKRVIKEENFTLLEQELPALCADRIDYSLRDMLNDKALTKTEIERILNSLENFEDKFVMRDKTTALFYARKFINQCLTSWVDPQTLTSFEIFGEIVREALKKEIISQKDLFMDDVEFLTVLKTSGNKKINSLLKKLSPNLKIEINSVSFDFETKGKVRYIDPVILINGETKKLSEVEAGFKKEIEKFTQKVKKGYQIKIL